MRTLSTSGTMMLFPLALAMEQHLFDTPPQGNGTANDGEIHEQNSVKQAEEQEKLFRDTLIELEGAIVQFIVLPYISAEELRGNGISDAASKEERAEEAQKTAGINEKVARYLTFKPNGDTDTNSEKMRKFLEGKGRQLVLRYADVQKLDEKNIAGSEDSLNEVERIFGIIVRGAKLSDPDHRKLDDADNHF